MAWTQITGSFLPALAVSHQIATRADICTQTGTVLVSGLRIKEGTVTIDRTAAIRRTCDVTLIADPTIIPLLNTDPLSPYGNELRLYRGVTYPNGSTEVVPLGVFRVSLVDIVDNAQDFTVEVTGYDRSRAVARAHLTDLFEVPAGTDYGAGIRSLIRPALPAGQQFAFTPSGFTTPDLIFEVDDDPWDWASQMAASIGGRVFFDQVATATLLPIPDSGTLSPIRTFAEGAGCTMTELEREVDDTDCYNHVLVQGQGTGIAAPIRSEAWDNRPASPTVLFPTTGAYPGRGKPPAVTGPYGDVVMVDTTTLVTTQGQADTYALSLLNDNIGLTESLTINAIPDPTLDADDVITVVRARSKVNAAYIVDAITMPLGPGDTMQITTRARRV